MSGTPPPASDLAAERAVLGAMLARPRSIVEVAARVKAADFLDPRHQLVFDAAVALDLAGSPVDSLTLASALESRRALSRVGLGYLAEFDTAAPSAANVLEYVAIVARNALSRRMAVALSEQLAQLKTPGADPLAVLAGLQRLITDTDAPGLGGDLRPVAEHVETALDVLERLRSSPTGSVTGSPTGFRALDLQLTGFHAGELIILAARPAVGKSAIAMQFAVAVARAQRAEAGPRGAVAVFSLEMPADQLVTRMLATESRVSLKRLREGGLTDHDLTKINEGAAELYPLSLHIDDSGTLDLFALRAKLQRLARRVGPLRLVVIDYLQLMGMERGMPREQAVAQVSRGLKLLAKDLAVPVIALAQLNRKVEERAGGRPQLSDLRESGSLEQDADVVLFLHPEPDAEAEDHGASSNGSAVDLIVAKQRNGPTGSIPLRFTKDWVRFDADGA